MMRKARAVLRTGVLLCLSVFVAAAAAAETQIGSSVSSRLVLAYSVKADGVAPWLPEGWQSVPFPQGPLAGANLLMVLDDQQIQTDAEGTPKVPAAKRFAVFSGFGKQVDGDAVRFFVYRVYASDMTEDPYGNATAADVSRVARLAVDADGTRARAETWRVAPVQAGGTLAVTLDFTGGTMGWAVGETKIYSNRIEDFHRIYRFRQLTELVTSTPAGKPLSGTLNVETSIEELAAVFDGTEALIAILDVPAYVRDIFLP